MCGDTRIPSDTCAAHTIPGETCIPATPVVGISINDHVIYIASILRPWGLEQEAGPIPEDVMESTREPHKPESTRGNIEINSELNRVEKGRQVFQAFYSRMAEVLPVEEILPDLVSNGLITMEEMEEILTEKTSQKKSRSLLRGPIWRSISGGYRDSFIKMLCIMQLLRNKPCVALSQEICGELDISSDMIKAWSADIISEWWSCVARLLFFFVCVWGIGSGTFPILKLFFCTLRF